MQIRITEIQYYPHSSVLLLLHMQLIINLIDTGSLEIFVSADNLMGLHASIYLVR